jgi:uncharacterized protein YndB with AHSA1/START domain
VPQFDDATITSASAVQVWKILYDPLRFPQWWAGFADAAPGDALGGCGDVTVWPDGYPDVPMPQRVATAPRERRIVVSCMVSDMVFEWRLHPAGDGTRISVHVEIPEKEAARLAEEREMIAAALRRLAALAEAS